MWGSGMILYMAISLTLPILWLKIMGSMAILCQIEAQVERNFKTPSKKI